MNNEKTLNKMAETPIKKLLLTTGIPMMISLMLQAVYNIVDSAFVSNMASNGEEALNALTLAFPVQTLIIAVGIGTGVGTNALISRSLGQGDKEKSSKVAGNSIFLALIITVLVVIFGFVGVEPYIATQTKNPMIYDMAVGYLKICCFVSFGNIFFAIFEKILQSTGLSLYSSIAMVGGALTNIILDPIMIYGLFGCPELGVDGAAYATVAGQIVSFVLALIFHLKLNKAVKIKLKHISPSLGSIKEIYRIGLPAIISQGLISIMTYAMNIILGMVSENMVTAYGLYYKIQQFLLFAAFGMRDAITPVIAFNYGHHSKQRVKETLKYGVVYTVCIMAAGIIILEICAYPLASIFGLSGTTEELFISAIRIISISLLFAGVNVSLQGAFQGLNAGKETLIVSIMRQLLFILPFAILFAMLAMNNSALSWTVWLTFIISEALTSVFAALFMKSVYKKKIKRIKD